MNQYSQTPPTYQNTPYQAPGYQPTGPVGSADDRNLGTIAHITPLILMLVSGGLAGFVGSLIVWLYAKDRSPAARQYATTALNIQIAVAIGAAISWVLTFVLIGFVMLPIVLVAGIIVHALGAIAANKGEVFNPPLVPTFVS